MYVSPILNQAEASFDAAPAERKVTLARLLCVLHPARETLDFLVRRIVPGNERLVGETLERIAQMEPDYLAATLDRLAREATPERRDLVAAACNRPAVYHALCEEAERHLEAERPEAAEPAFAALTTFAGERMLYALLRFAYRRGGDVPEPRFMKLLESFEAPKLVALIDREKESGDGRFLFNAILWLKGRGDKTRVARLVEIFSKLEYGVDAKEAAKKIGAQATAKPRDASRRVLAVVTPSQSITGLVVRSLADEKFDVEQCALEEPGKIAAHLGATGADLAIVDRQHAGRLGVAVALKLRALRPETPLVFAFDAIGEQDKADLYRAGVQEFVTIPFALEEMRHTVGVALERADREKVTRKAQFILDAGRDLFREGDAGDCCFIVKSGRVKIWRTDAAGREIHLTTLGGGEIFGEMALIDKSPRSATATAVERTELLRIEEANFEKVIQSNPGFALKMITILVKRLRNVTDRLKELESKERAAGR